MNAPTSDMVPTPEVPVKADDRKRRNRIIIILVLCFFVAALFSLDFHLGKFSDSSQSSTQTMWTQVQDFGPNFRPGPNWTVVFIGPSSFSSSAKALLPTFLSQASGSKVAVKFLSQLPNDAVEGNLLYIEFSPKGFWLSFYANYKDDVKCAFDWEGRPDRIKALLDSSSVHYAGQGFSIKTSIDSQGYGIGLLSRKATLRHRVSIVLTNVLKAIQNGAAKIRKEALRTKTQ